MKNPQRGISLVEILVASSVLSLILLVTTRVMIPALKAWSDGQKRSELTQNALVFSNWMRGDFLRSSPDSTEIDNNGNLVLNCALQQANSHELDFSERVIYWRNDTNIRRASQNHRTDKPNNPVATLDDLSNFDSVRRLTANVAPDEIDSTGQTVSSYQVRINPNTPWRVTLYLKLQKEQRIAEVQTSFSSIYAPFDTNIAEADNALE